MTVWGRPIERTFWQPAGGEASLAEVFDAAREAMVLVTNTNARVTAWERAYDERIDAIRRLTGETLENPMRADIGGVPGVGPAPVDLYLFEDVYLALSAEARAAFDARTAQIAEQRPEIAEEIGLGRPLVDDVNRIIQEAEERAIATFQSRPDLARWSASFGGGFAGAFRDPLAVYTMLIGAGAGAARAVAARILQQFGREATVNAVAEAALQPFVQSNRARAGLPSGIGIALGDILMAGTIGGVFGAGRQAIGEGARALTQSFRPRDPASAPHEVRGAAMALEVDEAMVQTRPGGIDPETTDLVLARAIEGAESPTRLRAAQQSISAALEPGEAIVRLPEPGRATSEVPESPVAVSPINSAELRTERLAAEQQFASARTGVDVDASAAPLDTPRAFTTAAARLPDEDRGAFRVAEPGGGGVDEALVARLGGETDQATTAQPSAPGTVEGRSPAAKRNEGQPYLLLSDRGRTLRDGVRNVVLVGPATALIPRLRAAFPRANFLTVPEAVAFMRSGATTPAEWRKLGGSAAVSTELADLGRRPGAEPFEPAKDGATQAAAIARQFDNADEMALPEGVSLQAALDDISRGENIAGLVQGCRLLG